MGMRLDSRTLVLTEDEYKQANNRWFIETPYDLVKIDYITASDYRKAVYFRALEDLQSYEEPIIINLSEIDNLEEWIEDNYPDSVDRECLPLTLQDFLNYDYQGEYVKNSIEEYTLSNGSGKIYIVTQVRYW